MRILALETSSRQSRIALLDGSELRVEVALDPARRTAQTLAPGIRQLCLEVGWAVNQLQLIVVTQGPGSFTGLRIGVTTAKSLAYAAGAEILGVNTLAAIAAQTSQRPVWAVVDAQRQQLFAALVTQSGQELASESVQLIDNETWLAGLNNRVAVTGPGLAKLRDRIPPSTNVIDESFWQPRASTVGRLGWHGFQQGQRQDVWRLAPFYGRKSAAEEKQTR